MDTIKKTLLLIISLFLIVGCEDLSDMPDERDNSNGHKELKSIQVEAIPALFQHVQDQSYLMALDSGEHKEDIESFSNLLLENTNIAERNDKTVYYSFLDDEMVIFNLDFSGDTDSTIGSSGDFTHELYLHPIDKIDIEKDTFIIKYAGEILNLTIVSEGILEDDNGSSYQIYDTNLEDIYNDFIN